MKWYAKFDGQTLLAGPQGGDPGGWTEVLLDEIPLDGMAEWDFSGPMPHLRAKVLSTNEQAEIEGRKVRRRREQLLQDSDWTDTVSAPGRLGQVLYDQWQTYRQALRDVTEQAGFPFEVVWPTPPT
jgi:hypothetical protein